MTVKETYKQRLRLSIDFSTPHWDRSIDNYKHYLGRLDVGNQSESSYPFVSKTVIPVSYETVETVMPRIIGKDPEFSTVAVEPDDVPFEQTAKLVVQTQYANPKLELIGEPMYLKLQRGVKEELITGNVVFRAKWRRQSRKMVKYLANLDVAKLTDSEEIQKVLDLAEELKKKGSNAEVTWSKKVIDSPFLDDFDIEHKPFFHFLPDPGFSETGKMRYKIEREMTTFADLVDEATIFDYDKATMDELQKMQDEGKLGYSTEVPQDFLRKYNELFANPDNKNSISGSDDPKKSMIMVDKVWEGDKVHVFVNEEHQLTGEDGMRNPYDVMVDPFIFGHDVVIPHSYFSRGEIDAIRKLEDGVTDIHNMRFDNLIQAMLSIWVYNPNMMANGDEFVPIPNSMTAVKDVDRAVRMFAGQDVTASAYKESDSLMAIIQRVTGVGDYAQGMEGDSLAGRSYGGMRLVQEAANARFVVKARLFEKLTLKALGYFILEMSKQFINKDRLVRIAGTTGAEEFTNQTIEAGKLKQIKGIMDIKVTPDSAMIVDQQADVMRLNAVADRFATQKGPFANIPEDVYDSFLVKYLTANGFHDAIYWVRAIRKARLEGKTEPKPTPQPELPPQLPPTATPAVPTAPVLQGDGQMATQPDPLAQILAAGGQLPPPEVIQ